MLNAHYWDGLTLTVGLAGATSGGWLTADSYK